MKTTPHRTARTNCLPDDEHIMFEICGRRQELIKTLILKSVYFVGLR